VHPDPSPAAEPDRRLAGWLDQARDRGFVGRAAEVESFSASLDGSSDVRVLFVHGPGGIGKTTLLDALARHVTRTGRQPLYLDARDIACTTTAVTAVIEEWSVRRGGAQSDGPDALLIDGYELFEPLDRWFREELVPSRPLGSVTVLAGRAPPQPGWWLDPGWRQLIAVHELTALDQPESSELLGRLGIGEEDRSAMARLGRGHPLVLAMLAESSRGRAVPSQLTDAPDVVGQLCRLIVDDIPDAAHRAGLATCAHANRMTQDLLERTVGSRSAEVWAWLESRPYVRRGAIGLFLHDVVRELFEAEFAHRSPDAYVALHRTVRGYFLERLVNPSDPHPDRAAAEILLLHRAGPLAGVTAQLRDGGLLPITRAGPNDRAAIFALIERGEGRASAELARRWVGQQPESLYRVRSVDDVEGFAMQVYLPTGDGLEADDPVARAVLRAIAEHGPLRPGERVNINRYSGATTSYQQDPMLLLVNGVSCILEWSHQPAAWTFITTIDGDFWGAYFEYLGMSRMFTLSYFGHEVAGYGWDRRRFPVTSLFELMTRRELSGETGPPPDDMMLPAPLSRSDFVAGVRAALLQLGRVDQLAASPLLGTRLVDPNATDPVAGLRNSLQTAIAGLAVERRGLEHRRVLERTYLKGARTQEVAAELLDLPFSTYRRHLAQAHERLIEVLWSVEIGDRRLPVPDRAGEQEVSTE
jgi:hypothetical protein